MAKKEAPVVVLLDGDRRVIGVLLYGRRVNFYTQIVDGIESEEKPCDEK